MWKTGFDTERDTVAAVVAVDAAPYCYVDSYWLDLKQPIAIRSHRDMSVVPGYTARRRVVLARQKQPQSDWIVRISLWLACATCQLL